VAPTWIPLIILIKDSADFVFKTSSLRGGFFDRREKNPTKQSVQIFLNCKKTKMDGAVIPESAFK